VYCFNEEVSRGGQRRCVPRPRWESRRGGGFLWTAARRLRTRASSSGGEWLSGAEKRGRHRGL